MKHIYLNLKRFEIPREFGGVNGIARPAEWAGKIYEETDRAICQYCEDDIDFAMYLPEAHILQAIQKKETESMMRIGCQGVGIEDVEAGKNFGAFTSVRTAKAMKVIGCTDVIIGHCEERKAKRQILEEAGVEDESAVTRVLNAEILRAQEAGLKVLYCIGESDKQRDSWRQVLSEQLMAGLNNTDLSEIIVAYEPVWAIGPGKVPPDREQIRERVSFIKECVPGIEVLYGGGLKKENAAMIAEIEELDGGLIALTRFTGDFGFYPDEYLQIVRNYMSVRRNRK